MATLSPFHLAFAVHDLGAARAFYGELLGCPEGRSAPRWVDFDFWGHQVVAHLAEGCDAPVTTNPVDGDDVPANHFGVVLPWEEWQALAARLTQADVPFLIAPRVRFEGLPGEQATFFIKDPSGNGLEFKSFRDPDQLFATKSRSA